MAEHQWPPPEHQDVTLHQPVSFDRELAGELTTLNPPQPAWANIGLRVKDIDFERRRLNVTANAVEIANVITVGTAKTHKRRSVPFPALLAPALREQCEGKAGGELVFASRHGTHERRWHNEHGWWPVAVAKAGLRRSHRTACDTLRQVSPSAQAPT